MAPRSEVLIVDDTLENLQLLSAILRAEGLNVRLAHTGAVALRSVAARRPDLILLDVRMPGMDGIEVCRQLRRGGPGADIPVLFLSASQEPHERLDAFAAGGLDFITKPFNAEEVLARVSTHLSLARLRSQLTAINAGLSERIIAEHRQRCRAEDNLRDYRQQLDLALGEAAMGTWIADGADAMVRFDRSASAILGRDDSTAISWLDLLDGFAAADRTALAEVWRQGVASDAVFEVEGRWTLAGDQRRIRLRGRCLPGDPARFIGLIWDVSGERSLEQRLAQAEKLESLGRLAGGLAHDLNNHLMIILGNLDLLGRSVGGEGRNAQRIAEIDGAATTATALVRDLLTVASGREAKAPIDPRVQR